MFYPRPWGKQSNWQFNCWLLTSKHYWLQGLWVRTIRREQREECEGVLVCSAVHHFTSLTYTQELWRPYPPPTLVVPFSLSPDGPGRSACVFTSPGSGSLLGLTECVHTRPSPLHACGDSTIIILTPNTLTCFLDLEPPIHPQSCENICFYAFVSYLRVQLCFFWDLCSRRKSIEEEKKNCWTDFNVNFLASSVYV